MRYKYLLLLIVPMVFFSCKKDKYPTPPPPPDPPVVPVLLKEIIIPNLPSPYYHFEYNTDGKAIFVSFASGDLMYDIVYVGGKISEMKNNTMGNKDRLQYFYDNAGRVDYIRYVDFNGFFYTRIFFTYDGPKLIKLEREMRSGAGFVLNKRLTMVYHADGNLKDLTEYRPPLSPQTEATYTYHFDEYDNKINADAFSLLHDEMVDHLILLPGVQLQKNNPRKASLTGDGLNYQIDYSYTYNEKNQPLTKRGEVLITNGPKVGERFQTNSAYSYY